MVNKPKGRGNKSSSALWFSNYSKYLKSPQWARKKALWFKVNGYWCRGCGARHELHLHHMSYKYLGNEPLSDLVALCKRCHQELTDKWRANKMNMTLRVFTQMFIAQKRRGNNGKRRNLS